MKDFLLLFCVHIDSENKRDIFLQKVKELKASGIDVCLCVHSPDYLSDFSPYVDYIYYDKDNEMLGENHFISNSEFSTTNYGKHSYYWLDLGYAKIEQYFLFAAHSKAILKLIKNGLAIANSNFYKWTIYMEGDLTRPTDGYKKFIEENINTLKSQNKRSLCYKLPVGFLWGQFFILESSLINDSAIMKLDWGSSSENWIKIFGKSHCESIVENLLFNYGLDSSVEKYIENEIEAVWGIREWEKLNNFHSTNPVIDNISIHLHPTLNSDGSLDLILFVRQGKINRSKIKNIKVAIDGIFQPNMITEYDGEINSWYMSNKLNLKEVKEDSKISLSYEYFSEKRQKYEYYEEYFLYKDTKHLYNNLLRITFR